MKKYRLSKSKYVRGLTCPKALWLTIHTPEKESPPSPALQYRFEKGIAIGLLAQGEFPGGLTIKTPSYLASRAVEETRRALRSAPPAIFEAAFFFDNILVRVDVLRRSRSRNGRRGLAWDLIEVKSTTALKAEHLGDVAVQRWVLEGCGVNLGGVFLMHLNSACTYPDLSDLFLIEEIGEQAEETLEAVPETLQRFRAALSRGQEPAIRIGAQCDDPYECSFKAHCWRRVPPISIFNIPHLRAERKAELVAGNVLRIEDLPPGYPLSDSQRQFVDLYRSGRPEIHGKEIRRQLDALEYPLYFLDFETDSPAVPRYHGTRPFEKVPFQYSCHRLEKEGRLEHLEYLHRDLGDPRPLLARSLADSIGPQGSIVAYNAPFERSVLLALAGRLPQLAGKLKALAARLWDLLDIFRTHYFDPAFGGSNSIKDVLPVLVPGLSYRNLEVRDGTEAQITWNRLLYLEPCVERDRLIGALRRYCRQDSLAMVEIFRALRERV